jgi:hypothetical protein
VVGIKTVSAARLEQKLPVGWTNPAGLFENFGALLEVTAQTTLIGSLNHPVQGVNGSRRWWFHRRINLDADAVCASSLCKEHSVTRFGKASQFGANGYFALLIGQKVEYRQHYQPSADELRIWNTER